MAAIVAHAILIGSIRYRSKRYLLAMTVRDLRSRRLQNLMETTASSSQMGSGTGISAGNISPGDTKQPRQ